MKVTKIITHFRAHVDELTAIWLLKRFGEKIFPGAKTAPVEYSRVKEFNQSPEQMEEAGILLIGIGGGRFDEHATAGNERKAESAAALIAAELSLADDCRFERILRYVNANDDNGVTQGPFDLANLVKSANETFAETKPELVYSMVAMSMDVKLAEAQRFKAAGEQFMKLAEIREFQPKQGVRCQVATVRSDNPEMAKFSSSRGMAVTVIHNPNGNIQVLSNKRFGLDMGDVVVQIRQQEARARGVSLKPAEAAQEGGVLGWYFQRKGQMILNGSRTAEVEPTKLTPQQVTHTVAMYAK